MATLRPAKIVRVGSGLGLILPVNICRALKINRGDYFAIRVADEETLSICKLKVVDAEDTGERREPDLPIIKNGE